MPIQRTDRVEGGLTVTTVSIDHPPVNVLDIDHCEELLSTLAEVHADDRTRVLILRGQQNNFSAGVDVKQHTAATMPQLLPVFHEIFHALLRHGE